SLARVAADRLQVKKKTRRAREANRLERAAFGQQQLNLPVRQLWVIDEFGIHLAMSRAYARAPRGERATVVQRFETGANWSVIIALTFTGVRVPMMIEGAIDGEVLARYVGHFLAPQLQPGDIVLWDQVPTHQNRRALALIEARGARVEPWPAYSP